MITIVARPSPLSTDAYIAEVPNGSSLAGLFGDLPECIIAQVEGRVLERDQWCDALADGAHVCLYSTPEGDGIGRAIAMIAVAVVAAYAAPALIGATSLTGGAALAGQAAVGAAITFAGSMAVNALIPPKMPSTPSVQSPNVRQSITGTQNRADPYGVVPRTYGHPRWYPKLAANPITEIAGNDQYLRMVLCLGYGPLEVAGHRVGKGYPVLNQDTDTGNAIRIGETNISDYEDVEWEIGTADSIELDYADIDEEAVGVALNPNRDYDNDVWVSDGVSAARTTAPNTKEISLDIVFPQGFFCINDNGTRSGLKVEFKIEYRRKGATTWQVHDANWLVGGGKGTKDTYRLNRRWSVPVGQYDVRLTRVRSSHGGVQAVYTDCQWAVLRSVQGGPSYKGNHVLMGLRIRATDQLNGVIDQLNVKTQAVLRVYDGSSFSLQATSNPAWAYLDAMTGVQVGKPVQDYQVDIQSIREWAIWCDLQGLRYSWVHDTSETVMERARVIATSGQASFSLQDGKFGVVRDDPEAPEIQVITPRNATGLSSQKSYKNLPHALRVKYIDSDTWSDAERIVYAPGYNESNATRFEDFETQGVEGAEEAWHHGQYYMRQAILRPETFRVGMDWENLAVVRGNRARLAYDSIKVGLGWGRVKSVSGDTVTLDSEVQYETSRVYGLRVRHENGDIDVYAVTGEEIGSTRVLEVVGDSHSIKVGELFAYGEMGKDTIDCKITNIQAGADFTADVTMVAAATNIYDFSQAPIYDPGITNPIPLDQIPPPIPAITSVRGDQSAAFQNPDGSFKTLIRVGYSFSAQVGLPSLQVEARYRVVGDEAWMKAGPFVASGNLTIDNVSDEQRYEIQLRARNGQLFSPWSQQVAFDAIGQQVSRPTSVEIDEHTFEIVIQPKGIYPDAKWQVYWSQTPLAEGDIVSVGNLLGIGSSFVHTGLTPDTTYYYYVRGWSANYTSAWFSAQGTTDNDPTVIMGLISGEIKQSDLWPELSDEVDKIPALEREAELDGLLESITSSVSVVQNAAGGSAYQMEVVNRVSDTAATATRIETLQATLGNDIASVQEQAQASIDQQAGRINAMWTLRVDANGLVGGVGLANDGQEVSFIVRADTFAVAPPGLPDNEVIPFFTQGSQTFIKEAMISELLFTKLRAGDGSLVFKNGKLQAEYIEVDQIVPKEIISSVTVNGRPAYAFRENGTFELNSSASGGRIVQNGDGIRVYNSSGRLLVRMGMW